VINNFIYKSNSGLYCAAGDFYIDPRKAVPVALISHAHGDHAVPTSGKVFCTAPTKAFMLHRQKRKSLPEFIVTDFAISFFIKDVKITFYPAGHILGSAQILMEYKSERYLYTGDFKIQPDDSCEKFQFVECDHLITETTFADPTYVHPDPVNELKNLLSRDTNVIIGAYALGKAQRLTKLISSNYGETNIYIHPNLESYHRIYEEYGYTIWKWKSYRKDDFNDGLKNVCIVPPIYFKKYKPEENVLKVFATGWKKSSYRCDGVLSVSDHADWPGLLELISKSGAKKVYTVHGKGNLLKEHLKGTIEVKIIA
jgi:putative mRNA 3-end processing factor